MNFLSQTLAVTALNLRTDRLESYRRGKPPRSTDGHPVLTFTLDRIA